MSKRDFGDLLHAKWAEDKFVCVGLDPVLNRIPESCRYYGVSGGILKFNRDIIEATQDVAACYKPNLAFYLRYGSLGIEALTETVKHILNLESPVPVILDGKFGDIGNTNDGFTEYAFEHISVIKNKQTIRGFDGVTVHPYLGAEAMKPFLDRADKGIFVLCRTSNPGAGEFQDLNTTSEAKSRPLWAKVTEHIARDWNSNGNCGVVAGATYPHELDQIRRIAQDLPILIPGVGSQGGDLEAAVKAGRDENGQGFLINSSRGIIYASKEEDFADAARVAASELHNHITLSLAVAKGKASSEQLRKHLNADDWLGRGQASPL